MQRQQLMIDDGELTIYIATYSRMQDFEGLKARRFNLNGFSLTDHFRMGDTIFTRSEVRK